MLIARVCCCDLALCGEACSFELRRRAGAFGFRGGHRPLIAVLQRQRHHRPDGDIVEDAANRLERARWRQPLLRESGIHPHVHPEEADIRSALATCTIDLGVSDM